MSKDQVTTSPLPPRSSSGKGSTPRNCNSKEFLSNYQEINWHRPPKIPRVEQADGVSKRGGGYHQFLKRRKHKLERRRTKLDPESQSTYGAYKGYQT